MDAVRGPSAMDTTPNSELRTVHHRVLLRIIGTQRKRPDHRMTSYNRALEITRYESIETKCCAQEEFCGRERSSA